MAGPANIPGRGPPPRPRRRPPIGPPNMGIIPSPPPPEQQMVEQYTGEEHVQRLKYPPGFTGRVEEAANGEIYITIYEWPAVPEDTLPANKRAVRMIISKKLLRKHMKETPEGGKLPVIKLDEPEIYDIIIE